MAETTTTEKKATTNINKGVEEATAKAAVELFNGSEVLFSIINTHSASLTAQMTDNYVENNFAIHDHIAIAPVTVTLKGIVAELVLTSKKAAQQAENELAQARQRQTLTGDFYRWENYLDPSSLVTTKLGGISQFVPQVSNYTRLAMNVVSYAFSAANNSLKNKWSNANEAVLDAGNINGEDSKTKIQKAYEQLKNTFFSRMPNKVYTPWETYDNMYIQNIEISQDDKNHIVDIAVTFKQLKFTSVQYGKVDENVRSAYNGAAREDLENNGQGQELEGHLHKFGVNAAEAFINGK